MSTSRRYGLLNVGLTGLLYQALSMRLVPLLPPFITANFITGIGLLICLMIGILINHNTVYAGIALSLGLFLDFLDGAVARYRKAASQFGGVFDATVDMVLWLSLLVGLYFHGKSFLPVALLVVSQISVYWRHILGHQTGVLDPGTDSYNKANTLSPFFLRLKSFLYPLINYYDSLTVLSLILIFEPLYIMHWIYYELIRRTLVLFKILREIAYIYQLSRQPRLP